MEEWAAPRFPDSRFGAISCCTLPVQVLVVDFLRSLVAECRMETSRDEPGVMMAAGAFGARRRPEAERIGTWPPRISNSKAP